MNKQAALEAAERLIRCNKKAKTERDSVHTPLTTLVTAIIGSSHLVEEESHAGKGRADIYVPSHRFVAEAKKPASREGSDPKKLPVTQAQIGNYIKAFRDDQLSRPSLYQMNDPWTEVICDGHQLHIREYPHTANGQPRQIITIDLNPIFASPQQVVNELQKRLSKQTALPWIPKDPDEIIRLFAKPLDLLKQIHLQALNKPKLKQQIDTSETLWYRTLESTGTPPSETHNKTKVFITQSHMLHLTEAIIKASIGKPYTQTTYQHQGFHNWVTKIPQGKNYLKQIETTVQSYEWRHRSEDILQSLYMGIVDEEDREQFGKHYTPDWLAGLLAEKLLDDTYLDDLIQKIKLDEAEPNKEHLKSTGILDPACGSGTLLLASIKRISEHATTKNKQIDSQQLLKIIYGIDADPIAVALTKTNIARRLSIQHPNDIQIYLGDSLMNNPNTMMGQSTSTFHSNQPEPTGTPVYLPEAFIDHPKFNQYIHTLVACANPNEKETLENNPHLTSFLNEKETQELRKAHNSLRKIIETEGNSIWGWYATQTAGINRLRRRKISRILANPPWIPLNKITNVQRANDMEALAKEHNLWTGGKNASAFDIAQTFVRHTQNLYLDQSNKNRSNGYTAGFITNAAARKASNWEQTRSTEGTKWKTILDFSKFKKPPFHGANCCIILINHQNKNSATEHISVTHKTKSVKRDIPWSNAKQHIQEAPIINIITQAKLSYYAKHPREGASLKPSVLTILPPGTKPTSKPNSNVQVTTAPSRHKPWKDLPTRTMTVPKHYICNLLKSGDILPYVTRKDIHQAVIPFNQKRDALKTKYQSYPKDYQDNCDVYEENCSKGKNNPQTLLESINYGNKLARQLPLNAAGRIQIAYPSSGANMKACLVPTNTIVHFTAYRMELDSFDEAFYLLAILNAGALNATFQEARDSDRDFVKTPFTKIPTPAYDPTDLDHQALVTFAQQAQQAAEQKRDNTLATANKEPGLNKFPDMIREHLKSTGITGRIDAIVKRLLPNYTI